MTEVTAKYVSIDHPIFPQICYAIWRVSVLPSGNGSAHSVSSSRAYGSSPTLLQSALRKDLPKNDPKVNKLISLVDLSWKFLDEKHGKMF